MNWSELVAAAIISLPAYLAFWQGVRNGRKSAAIAQQLAATHELVNGMTLRKEAAIRRDGLSEGEAIGVAKERADPQVRAGGAQ